MVAFAARAHRLQVVGDRLAPRGAVVGVAHVRRLRVMEGDIAARHRADNGAAFVDLANQQVALHAFHRSVREHAILVAAIDEMHAAVDGVDVLQRNPAGDAAVVEIAAPVAFVLVPVGRQLLPGGLPRNWSYQNVQCPSPSARDVNDASHRR